MSFSIPSFELDQNMAYARSGSDEYFGWAPKGATTADAKWKIIMLDYTGNNWVKKYPNGSPMYKFVWDNVTTYTYSLLKQTEDW